MLIGENVNLINVKPKRGILFKLFCAGFWLVLGAALISLYYGQYDRSVPEILRGIWISADGIHLPSQDPVIPEGAQRSDNFLLFARDGRSHSIKVVSVWNSDIADAKISEQLAIAYTDAFKQFEGGDILENLEEISRLAIESATPKLEEMGINLVAVNTDEITVFSE